MKNDYLGRRSATCIVATRPAPAHITELTDQSNIDHHAFHSFLFVDGKNLYIA
jgi:hypothetical protein